MTITIKRHQKGLCVCLPQEAEWASITHSHSPGKIQERIHLAGKEKEKNVHLHTHTQFDY